jgi:enoyl-CoA hydratase
LVLSPPRAEDSPNRNPRADDPLLAEHTPAVYAAKEAVNRAHETTLAEGVRFERRIFHSLFATEDQKEGMRAFAEKRPAAFRHR